MVAFVQVDRRNEMFGSTVTIADLAANSFPDHQCAFTHIYEVWEVLERDWAFELNHQASESEYATGVLAHFRDGSGCRHCRD